MWEPGSVIAQPLASGSRMLAAPSTRYFLSRLIQSFRRRLV
jgi:hypothetical protein